MPFNKINQSKGGQVTAQKRRQKALKEYYENPNRCLYCNEIIKVKDNEKVAKTKTKKFCSVKCKNKSQKNS